MEVAWLTFTKVAASRHAPTWSKFRERGNSALVKGTILLPVVGYLFLFSSDLQTALMPIASNNRFIGFELKLELFYFGMVFMAAFSLIYSSWCPEYVKRFGSADQFAERAPFLSVLEKNHFREVLDQAVYGGLRLEEARANLPHRATIADGERELLSLYYDHINRCDVIVRMLCQILFIFGSILIFIPSLDTFASVSAKLIDKLFS